MSSWALPPWTPEVRFDEKRSFVGKKPANCNPADPADDPGGDYRDYIAFDPEHRLVRAVVPGARTEENGQAIVAEVEGRLGGAPPELMTGDEDPVYEAAIRDRSGEPIPTGRQPGRPRPPSAS